MAGRKIDLHVHSTASDGSLSPREIVEAAKRAGVGVLSLTDHDSLDGIPDAIEQAERAGIRILSGVELSVTEEGIDVHLLAYGFDLAQDSFRTALIGYREARRARAIKILARLKGLGIRLSFEEVEEIAAGASIGRPHVAEALMRNGFVETFNEAFQRFLGHHAPAYVPKRAVTLEEAVALVREAGGVTVLAHPGPLNRDHLIPGWSRRGLDGIEVWHAKHDAGSVARYRDYANLHGLLMTGGSDFHGERTPDVRIGGVDVPAAILDPLDEALRARRPARAPRSRALLP